MLVREVVAGFDGKVTFVNEDFGESALAARFGIRRYPAVFVDEVLIAKPKDFGFFGEGGSQGEGRYTPWKDAASHARFKSDLERMIGFALARDTARLRAGGVDPTAESPLPASLPAFSLVDLDGRPLSSDQLAGRVVIVEFWASWCPPCMSTLAWLDRLDERYGDRVALVALAVESLEDQVVALARAHGGGTRWAMATAEVAVAFGDVVAVPTMLVFDRRGRAAATYHGAPPGLHEQVERLLGELLGRPGD
ncbi:MAG TPA: TlpA disulfide reductase family protein [Candidatus Polarisedimenticolaceae bacterium]|nr:TlpA disulfide reductase family protein [Candidatus Polarisedimenticolaceae bacterium]